MNVNMYACAVCVCVCVLGGVGGPRMRGPRTTSLPMNVWL